LFAGAVLGRRSIWVWSLKTRETLVQGTVARVAWFVALIVKVVDGRAHLEDSVRLERIVVEFANLRHRRFSVRAVVLVEAINLGAG
jgi:hypothetical protein